MQAISLREDANTSGAAVVESDGGGDPLEMRDLQEQMRTSQAHIKELNQKLADLFQLLQEHNGGSATF